MTTEEKLAMLRSQAKLYLSAHKAELSAAYLPPWVEEELWLLEVVANLKVAVMEREGQIMVLDQESYQLQELVTQLQEDGIELSSHFETAAKCAEELQEQVAGLELAKELGEQAITACQEQVRALEAE